MKGRVLIRVHDGQLMWESRSGATLQYEDLNFGLHDNHGEYLSLVHGERKAAVFPFEAFSIADQLFYYGPRPNRHAPLLPCSNAALRPSHISTPSGAGLIAFLHLVAYFCVLAAKCISLFSLARQRGGIDEQRRIQFLLAISLIMLPAKAVAPQFQGIVHGQIQEIVATFEMADHLRITALNDDKGAINLTSRLVSQALSSARPPPPQKPQKPNQVRGKECKIGRTELRILSPQATFKFHQHCNNREVKSRP